MQTHILIPFDYDTDAVHRKFKNRVKKKPKKTSEMKNRIRVKLADRKY